MVKIERTPTPPASLAIEAQKKAGSYTCPDVIELLHHDFHGKCYICENKPLTGMQVEHLLPHQGRSIPERIFDWNNLFYSCSHCNSLKNKAVYDGHILNCCIVDPEEQLNHIYTPEHVHVICIHDDETNMRTAQLIESAFEEKNDNPAIRNLECQNLFNDLSESMVALFHQLENYRENPTPRVMKCLKALLVRESKYAAFKRWYVRAHIEQYPDLAAYIN